MKVEDFLLKPTRRKRLFRGMDWTWCSNRRSTVPLIVAAALVLLLQPLAFGQKWKEGDVFVGVGGGSWQVYRPSTGAFVDSVSDGLSNAGATNGSAIDNTWHLIGTDSGRTLNISSIIRFRISPHDPNNLTAVSDVLSVKNGSTGTNSVNPQAVVIAKNGNIILANATPATIAVFDFAGTFVTSFPLASRVIDRSLASADLSADGSSLLYTSGGANIRKLQLSGSGAGSVTTFASLSGQRLFGIRVVPVCSLCSSGSGVLVAARSTIFLLDGSSAATVAQYTISGQSDLKVLALDPLVQDQQGNKLASDFFWAASPTASSFWRVSFTTGQSQAFTTVNGVSGIASLSTYAGFSANQPVATQFPVASIGSSPSTSQTFLYGTTGNSDQLTLTGYGTAFNTNATVFASSVPPPTGNSDDGLPCTPTVSGLCTIWSIDTDPPLPSGALISMKIFSDPPPPTTLLNQTQLLRNEREDVTTAIRNADPAGASRFSIYTLNNRANENDEGCTYFPPITEGATLNNPGNVTFRFQCTGLPGAQLHTLSPRISIVRFTSGAAPLPFFPGVTTLTGGTCCTIAKYRYDAQSNTWVINVSFSGVTGTANFVATTFDDNHIASSFDVGFSVAK
jgi:hypothetical protein